MARKPSCLCGRCKKCRVRKCVANARAHDKKVTNLLRDRIAELQSKYYPYIEGRTYTGRIEKETQHG